jgi:predicted ester cyclase
MYEENGTINGKRKIPATDLVPAFHDDNNVFDNSYYSGISAVWPILSVAQTIDAINDEDLPESARQLHAKFGIMYAGTSNKSTLRKLKENLEASTWLIHNEAGLTADVHDLARDLMELPNVQQALAKYICQSMSLPLFLLFEDTANFATANQVMQVYKAGQLNRYRTWFRGILEKYWYDPILADHLDIELKDVISADIKIKAMFPDINFETRKEIIEGDQNLQNMLVYKPSDSAKDIGRPDIASRLQFEEAELNDSIKNQRLQSIEESASRIQDNTKEKPTPKDE